MVTVSGSVIHIQPLLKLLSAQLGVRSPMGMDLAEGLPTLIGGRGRTLDVLPADAESWEQARILDQGTIEFPLVQSRFRLQGDYGKTDLLIEMGLEITVTGTVASCTAQALGLPPAGVQVA